MFQRFLIALTALVLVFGITGCAKELAEELGVIPETPCGSDGARMQATINGTTWCADGNLTAMGDPSEVLINGIGLTGRTMTLQLGDLSVGQHPINESGNAVLMLELGVPFNSTDSLPGTLTVTAHDTLTHRLQAEFLVELVSPLSSTPRQVSGIFDVHYAE